MHITQNCRKIILSICSTGKYNIICKLSNFELLCNHAHVSAINHNLNTEILNS